MKLTLNEAVRALRQRHGPPAPPPTRDPFDLVLWEKVACLASPARRARAFDLLKRTVGARPEQLLHARPSLLRRVAAHGILKDTFASKLGRCPLVATVEFDGKLLLLQRGRTLGERTAPRCSACPPADAYARVGRYPQAAA